MFRNSLQLAELGRYQVKIASSKALTELCSNFSSGLQVQCEIMSQQPSLRADLQARYEAYILCLNERRWEDLRDFVDQTVVHNERLLGLGGYMAMLEADVARIPDLQFTLARLLIDEQQYSVAAIIQFDCTPAQDIFDTATKGRRVQFTENVFYRFEKETLRIVEAHSIIDIAAIRSQVEQQRQHVD